MAISVRVFAPARPIAPGGASLPANSSSAVEAIGQRLESRLSRKPYSHTFPTMEESGCRNST
jgi:hypothetical protein